MKRLFDWIINTFSYTQIYFFIGMFLLLSLLPIIFFWIETNLNRFRLIDEQVAELVEFAEVKKFYDAVQQHRLLRERFSYDKNPATQAQIVKLEEDVRQEIFESGKELDPRVRVARLSKKGASSQKIHLFNHYKRWNDIINQSSNFPAEVIEFMHTSLIDDINMEFGYLADRSGTSYFQKLDKYVFLQGVFLMVISLNESLSEFILFSERLLNNSSDEPVRGQILAFIEIINTNLSFLNDRINLYLHHNSLDTEERFLFDLFNKYSESFTKLINLVKQHILPLPAPDITLAEFQAASQASLKISNQLWDELLKAQDVLFKTEKARLIYQFWLILLTTLFLISLAFFLEFKLTYGGIKRLSQLTQATDDFTKGNLAVRIPEHYQDEIGRQAQAFNRMAQRLEELINHLYDLINATSDLANGNLRTRIPILDSEEEFGRVSLSFNKMAETFETIIGRLKQIGLTLTTSASEIASASKDQETIVVEQEATTREIAVAANEISSNAKEFAVTMNEVSVAADKTSDLALKGKGSLNNMESIMHNMVEASSKIASKLSILNEKASNITSVITTITKVADQTNLLSLNASIEAEKAGEYGRSFAVIAREIRRLADQTAIATLDIEKMVNEIMAAVSSSVMGVDDFNQEIRNGVEKVRSVSEQLATIIEQVRSFTGRFELVNQGMQAQSTGAEQINEAIAQLSQTARQTTEAIHQFHKTIQGLNQAANELGVLNPFLQKSSLEENFPLERKQIETNLLKSPDIDSKKQIHQTLSNLNVAANKLKDVNVQLKPSAFTTED